MFPNPWATSVPPPAPKSMVNSFENNAPHFPFYVTQNPVQNISMAQSLQPNAIDPAMVQKWQEWKQWELWQQQFQQWQQQTGQITTTTPQPAPPLPPGQPSLSSSQHPTIPFQNQQYSYNQPTVGPSLPQLINQPQQITTKTEVGIKRGLEPEYQNNEKKLKIDTANKKEIELNDETEALFEEQFKSWEEQFLKWKEQNKNHPDKVQYIEYEKKWLNWRDHLKQKCEILKKKREMKMAEKKKETIQIEEDKLQSQQKSTCNQTMLNVPILTNEPSSTFQQLHNNSMVPPTSINQIPGLDLVSNNENVTRGFLNVSNILPQNQNGPIQTPDDKPFNFPKSITNPTTINPHSVNIPHGNINQPSTSMYQNSNSWSKYNNPVIYYNQKPSDVDNTSIPKFGQQTETSSRLPYDGDMSNTTYNNSQNASNMDYRRSLEGSYNKSSNDSPSFNKPQDVQPFNRNFNASSSNYRDYNQPNSNISHFNNFNRPSEKSNTSYQQPLPSLMNTTTSKPPSLLSLNLVKPVSLDKVGSYSESKNVAPNRYDRNWNNGDDEDDPENEYMEAHKKFSSEHFDDQNDDKFSNNIQHRNVYNENKYSRGQQGARNFNDDYLRSFNQSRGSQFMRNSDSEYLRNNSQFSRNNNQSYPRELPTSKINENNYYKPPNNKCMDQGFPREAPFSKDIDKDYSNKSTFNKNNYASQKGNYGPSPLRGNYDLPRGNFGNYTDRTNMEWDKNYTKNEELQQPIQNIIDQPQVIKKSFEEVLPIDPVKIFDYRHLPSLKVIPGLSKETVIPIRVYDYKHGGKRILPWQDRGFSRRNMNQTRDLNDKDEIIQNENYDSNLSGKILNKIPTFNLNETSSEEKSHNVFDAIINDNFYENKENKEEKKSNTIETTVIDNDEEKEETLKPVNEVNNMCAPSPPRMSINNEVEKPSNRKLLTIDTLLCPPGRLNRPSKIVIILRGLPGSGKSYVAKLIKEKEVAMGGQAPRILSLDDYFMTEVTKTEIDPETNKKVEKKVMEYEYDSAAESSYRTSFIKAFKKKMLENYFSFYIIDAINNKVAYYKEILDISRANGFTIYIIELECDVDLCIKRNIHNRTAYDINSIMKSWVKTPDDQILLDIQSLLHSSTRSEVEMEDVSDIEMELDKDEETVDNSDSAENKNVDFEEEDVMKLLSCKWTDTIPQEEKMKRLDGLCKKKNRKLNKRMVTNT
uniref:YLP motif-containing protein 1 n=1 Tax=Sipha flava TaxID=143950 RepID=A0A2S2PV52_9HEMI